MKKHIAKILFLLVAVVASERIVLAQGEVYNTVNPFNASNIVEAYYGNENLWLFSAYNTVQFNLTGNSTPSSVAGIRYGTHLIWTICEPSTVYTFAYPSQIVSGEPVKLTANTCTTGSYTSYDGSTLQNDNIPRAYQLQPFSTLASAATIAPLTSLFNLTGTTSVTTITPPSGMSSTVGGCLDFYTTAAVPFATGGNLAANLTTTAGTQYRACYFGSLWYIK